MPPAHKQNGALSSLISGTEQKGNRGKKVFLVALLLTIFASSYVLSYRKDRISNKSADRSVWNKKYSKRCGSCRRA